LLVVFAWFIPRASIAMQFQGNALRAENGRGKLRFALANPNTLVAACVPGKPPGSIPGKQKQMYHMNSCSNQGTGQASHSEFRIIWVRTHGHGGRARPEYLA
jgi:hypothetical protein